MKRPGASRPPASDAPNRKSPHPLDGGNGPLSAFLLSGSRDLSWRHSRSGRGGLSRGVRKDFFGADPGGAWRRAWAVKAEIGIMQGPVSLSDTALRSERGASVNGIGGRCHAEARSRGESLSPRGTARLSPRRTRRTATATPGPSRTTLTTKDTKDGLGGVAQPPSAVNEGSKRKAPATGRGGVDV